MNYLWVVVHFELKDEDTSSNWIVDYVGPTERSAKDAVAEFNEADETIEYFVGVLHTTKD